MSSCDGPATSERWCCGDSTDRCSTNLGVVTLKQVFQATLSGYAIASSDASATTSEPAASVGDPASHSGEVNGGVIAGAVVRATIGLAVLLAIVCISRRRSLRKVVRHESTGKESTASGGIEEGLRAEVDGTSQRHEMSQPTNRNMRQELPGLSPTEWSASALR